MYSLRNIFWYVTESLVCSVGVSAAENCSLTDYSVAHEALFQHLVLDKNGVQMTHMRPLSWGPVTRVYVDLYVTSIIEVV